MNKIIILVMLLIIPCYMSVSAQTSYYYYKGQRIPLTVNDDKVCVSIPKDKENVSKDFLKGINVLDRIKDADFDIFIIRQSDLKRMSASSYWMKDKKSILLSSCYITMDSTEVFSTPYINVRLKKEQDAGLLSSYAERYGLRIVKQDKFMPLWYILSISSETGEKALEIANTFWESGLFAASVPDLCSDDLTYSDDLTRSNDPMFYLQWGLRNSEYAGIDISACDAWIMSTGKNVKIAILDTGVDLSHIDLASNISSMSYDTETDSSPSIVYSEHGTHCAGIAAAVKDNGIQVAGVAPEATIVSVSNSLSSSTNSQLKRADGIIWAYQNAGVDIISNSWRSGTQHAAIDEAIQNAFRYGRQGKGCVIVFASGNQYHNYINYPANSNDTILAVGSINSVGERYYSSNYGTGLDIVAPGVDILSTLPDDDVGYKTGTSMACPHVAGVAALVLERNSELSVTQVNSIINSSAKKTLPNISFNIPKPDGLWNEQYGYGLVDACSAVLNTPSAAYIQNENITGERIISADSIFVGKDVTDDKPYGNVTLGQGNIKIKANYVKIKNSASVPLGTKLRIGN